MKTLYDFGIEVQNIREAIDSLEVKGAKNASYVVYAYNKCNDIIQAINDVISQQVPPDDGQNGEDTIKVHLETDDEPVMDEEGEGNGEPNSGTST